MLGLDKTQVSDRCSVDICDLHVYVLIGNSDTSSVLFLKVIFINMSILMGFFYVFERW